MKQIAYTHNKDSIKNNEISFKQTAARIFVQDKNVICDSIQKSQNFFLKHPIL